MAKTPNHPRPKPIERVGPIVPGTPLHKLLEMTARAIVEGLAERPSRPDRRRRK